MTEDNVMEFCQWLVSEKGIEAGNLSDYINNNEEEVLKLAEEFKKPKFKIGGKIEAAVKKLALGDVLVKKTKTPIYTVVDSDGRIVEIEDPYDSEKKTIKLKLSQGDDGGTGRLVLGSDGLRDTRAYQKIFDLIEEDFKNKLQSNTAVEEQKDRISQLERELLLKDFESTNQKMAGFKVPVIKTPTLKSMTSGIGIKQSGGSISRREFKNLKESRKDVRSQAKELFGFNNGQFSTAYSGLKNAFLNNGLSRREAKLAAQRSLMNRTATPIVEDAPTNPHYSYQAPTKSYSYTDFNEMELEPMNITPMGYDTMSFNDAFASARRAGGNTGNNTFRWRGKLYGTKLAGEVNGNTNKTVDLKNNYDLNIDEEPMYITPMGYDAMSLNSAFARAWEQRSKTGKKYLKYNGEVYDLDEIENIDLGVDFKDLEEGYNHWRYINWIPYFYWNNGKVIKPGQHEYDKWINWWIDYYKSNPGPESEKDIKVLSKFLKCGGKVKKVEKKATGGPQGKVIDTPNGPIFETENGYVDVDGRSVDYNNKLQNIRDRHNMAKKRVFAQGNTSYDMTIGPDLDLFNDFNGKTDTLIRKSVGFRSPKEYSNEDLGHRLETIFPRAAKFFGYKSGFQKALDDINKMEPGGKVDLENNRQQYKKPMKIIRPVPGGGEVIMYPGLKDTMFEFMPDPGKRVIVDTKDSVGTGFDINGNINKIPADSTAKIKDMLYQTFNIPIDKK